MGSSVLSLWISAKGQADTRRAIQRANGCNQTVQRGRSVHTCDYRSLELPVG